MIVLVILFGVLTAAFHLLNMVDLLPAYTEPLPGSQCQHATRRSLMGSFLSQSNIGVGY